jgi:glycosyltransferase involved in cell wall biosynthesis
MFLQKQICIVDDASGDETGVVCDALKSFVSIILEQRKRAALDTGFKYLLNQKKAKWVITMDADGQHAPEDLANFWIRFKKIHFWNKHRMPHNENRCYAFSRICSNRITSLSSLFLPVYLYWTASAVTGSIPANFLKN